MLKNLLTTYDLKSAASKNGMQDKGMGIANPQV